MCLLLSCENERDPRVPWSGGRLTVRAASEAAEPHTHQAHPGGCAWDLDVSGDVGLSVTRPGESQARPDAGHLSLAATVPCMMRLSTEKRAEAWRGPGIPHASAAG